jgi:hypothetical protein
MGEAKLHGGSPSRTKAGIIAKRKPQRTRRFSKRRSTAPSITGIFPWCRKMGFERSLDRWMGAARRRGPERRTGLGIPIVGSGDAEALAVERDGAERKLDWLERLSALGAAHQRVRRFSGVAGPRPR